MVSVGFVWSWRPPIKKRFRHAVRWRLACRLKKFNKLDFSQCAWVPWVDKTWRERCRSLKFLNQWFAIWWQMKMHSRGHVLSLFVMTDFFGRFLMVRVIDCPYPGEDRCAYGERECAGHSGGRNAWRSPRAYYRTWPLVFGHGEPLAPARFRC